MTLTLDASQARAVALMQRAPICVVTGGPGVGKTTCLRTAVEALEASGTEPHRIALASPTGKAARRISEATGRTASTIHRLLGFVPGGTKDAEDKPTPFEHHQGNPLDADVVIVDEASMICIELGAHLLAAIDPSTTRLVLVGDADQLPPVGPGSLFADLIASGTVPVARLTTLHRAAAESWVCSQAPEILAGRVPDLRTRRDFRWLEHEGRNAAVDALVEEVRWRTLRGSADDNGSDDVQVIVPQTVGPAGTRVINARLQEILNARKPGARDGRGLWRVGGEEGGYELRVGDRVIATRNDYTRDVMNGEIGVVIEAGDDELVVGFEALPEASTGNGGSASNGISRSRGANGANGGNGSAGSASESHRRVSYDRQAASTLQLAYALTCHRMQGSECAWAVVFCHSTHTRMLDRTLLYTAITRAKRGVVLVGDRAGIERAVKNASAKRRNTGLAERLRDAVAAGESASEWAAETAAERAEVQHG